MECKLFESEVVSTIRNNAGFLTGGNISDWHITSELDSGYGIADLAFFCLDNKIIEKRILGSNMPLLSRQAVRSLMAFRDASGPITVSYLTKQLGISEQTVKNSIIKFLENSGYIIKEGEGFRFNYFEEVFNKSIAIEAKISDWKRGLYQAYRYKWFSNKSYLALYYKHTKSAENNLKEFERLNIGLLSVYDDKIKVLYEPNEETPVSSDMAIFASERAFGDYLKNAFPWPNKVTN